VTGLAIEIKRIYEPANKEDGYRVLVDRLWPRGLRKVEANVDLWLKDIGPSGPLRKWFDHEPEKWEEFKKRYAQELDEKKDLVEQIESKAKTGKVTLLFASHEKRYNNAHALKEYLERRVWD
jgi:uncharacterized protein YeaO (DUF488 family)